MDTLFSPALWSSRQSTTLCSHATDLTHIVMFLQGNSNPKLWHWVCIMWVMIKTAPTRTSADITVVRSNIVGAAWGGGHWCGLNQMKELSVGKTIYKLVLTKAPHTKQTGLHPFLSPSVRSASSPSEVPSPSLNIAVPLNSAESNISSQTL